MTKRRVKFRRHSGKMIKLYKDLFLIHRARGKMSRLLLLLGLGLLLAALSGSPTARLAGAQQVRLRHAAATARQERKLAPAEQADPMEPCYLANNRASETLTISESTPVGTVVGELMVSKQSTRTTNHLDQPQLASGSNLALASASRSSKWLARAFDTQPLEP